MPRLLTGTFTTAAFDRSSFRQFGASPYRAAPKDLPSSLAQHGASRLLDTTTPLRRQSEHKTLDSAVGRIYHRTVTASFPPCLTKGGSPQLSALIGVHLRPILLFG